ncbi:hypothetical protein GGR56DRAFT_643709 [Xylariaceae sp. FL0804]|nr:hypothetical protein GGR56DRAFT_643709 [Xylariaceae sp. FL0804]
MAKSLKLGQRLRYPITISKLIKKTGDDVVKQEPILQYSFKFERRIGDPKKGEERVVQETGIAEWDSPVEGKIKQWRVVEGQLVKADQDFIVIEETCSHEVQYAGLCAICGRDMKEATWATETLDTERATVSMVHDNVALTVSQDQAERAEMQLQRRLLKERKLSLVVDLDQTIIHACIEPTVGEWQRDPSSPNYEAVKDVRSFQLDDGPRGLASGCWYYIKMRPGLAEFLEKVAELFELHVYTMGTRAYALNIAKIVDPTQKLFGNRVISRDENGSMSAKSLQRLFPVSTNMVVVIDDRADVWPRNRPNLIKVTPYDFFKGIGDINSSFLPKREDIIAATPIPDPKPEPAEANGAAKTDNKAEHEKAVANSSDENALLQLQAEEQERTLEKQLKDRPLLHLQEELDREDGQTESQPEESSNGSETVGNGSPEPLPHHRHNVLHDDDQELTYLERHLTDLHHAFYDQYEARSADRRLDEIRADVVPDVGSTLTFLKSQVLKHTRIVLSGLVPLGVDVHRSEVGIHAESFGADVRTKVSRQITHLVISSSRPRTQKVRQAARFPHIKIVNQNWLADSLARWEKLDETPYLVQVHPSDRNVPSLPEDESTEGRPSPPRPRITIVQPGQAPFEEGQDDESDVNDTGGEGDEDDGEDYDEDDDRYNVMPDEPQDGERSPIENFNGMGWDDIDQELNDFMGSEDELTDGESTQGTDHGGDEPSRGLKRSFDESSDDGVDGSGGGSVLSKKQRLAKARTTGLRNMKVVGEDDTDAADADGSGLPTPLGTGDEEDAAAAAAAGAPAPPAVGDYVDGGGGGDDDDDDDFDLEAALEAELEAEGQG